MERQSSENYLIGFDPTFFALIITYKRFTAVKAQYLTANRCCEFGIVLRLYPNPLTLYRTFKRERDKWNKLEFATVA